MRYVRCLSPSTGRHVKFRIDGVDYDGALMERFETSDPSEPTIFMDRYCQVFVVRCENGHTTVSLALSPEIHRLFEKYGVQSLLRALRGPRP
jgi:hypothetical protein